MASFGQVGSRAERMGLQGSPHLYLYSATRLVEILQEIVAMQPRAVVIDSIQTVYLDDVNGSAGSVSQVLVMRCIVRVQPASLDNRTTSA